MKLKQKFTMDLVSVKIKVKIEIISDILVSFELKTWKSVQTEKDKWYMWNEIVTKHVIVIVLTSFGWRSVWCLTFRLSYPHGLQSLFLKAKDTDNRTELRSSFNQANLLFSIWDGDKSFKKRAKKEISAEIELKLITIYFVYPLNATKIN